MRKLALALLFACFSSLAQQTVISDYATSREDFFWPELYDDTGETLYCGIAFNSRQGLTVEHVYPASWMAAARGCPNRNQCPDPFFHHAEADLHNLWPAHPSINFSRGNQLYGELPGESERRFTAFCPDFERNSGASAVVEPRDSVKGEIARSIFYMVFNYGFPMQGMGPMLFEWHESDPVNAEECRRNAEILALQGTSNPFIGGCQSVPTPPPVISNTFTCGTKNTCGQMDSCEEAIFHLTQCGLTNLDGNNDGIPCQAICGN